MANKVISTVLRLRDEMSGGLMRVARNTQGVSQEMKTATHRVIAFKNKGVKAITDFSKKMVTVGVGGFTGFAAYSLKAGSDFEAQMSKVSAISGATAGDIEKLTSVAKEMGSKTQFSATESAQALEYMAMAGWKTDQMVSGLPGIMNLAAASGEDLSTVSDIVTDALTGFGLQAESSAHFADVLAKASSNSNTSVSLMGETFKYAAPVAGALKYSIEDTAVAVGLMANAGIKGSEAGTALRGILTNLAKPSDSVVGYMKELGISLTDSSGAVKPLATQMKDLRQKFANLTEAQKAEYAAGIAGKEAMSGLLAIVNASDDDFNNLTNAIANSSGTAQAMADEMNDNLKGKLGLLKSAVEGVGITFYDAFEDKAKGAVEAIANKLSEWQEDGTIEAIAQTVGDFLDRVVQNATSVFGWFKENGDKVITVIKVLGITLLSVKLLTFVGNLVSAINTLVNFANTVKVIAQTNLPTLASGFVGAATKLFGLLKAGFAFVVANPIVLGITAAIIAGIALWKNWDKVKEVAVGLWEKIKEVFGGIKDAIVGAFDDAKEKVKGFFKWIDDKIENIPVIGDLYSGGKKVIKGAANTVKGWFGGSKRENVGKNALGTSYWRGGLTSINERGGEIINLPSGSQIIPHDISMKMADNAFKVFGLAEKPRAMNRQKTNNIVNNNTFNMNYNIPAYSDRNYIKMIAEQVAGEILKQMNNMA